MATTLSEDTIIFNALNSSNVNMELVYKAIERFISLKKTMDATDRFNFIACQENGPDYLEDFTPNSEVVINGLKQCKTSHPNIAGGIFTAMTLVVEVWKKIPDKCFRLIILTDSASLPIPNPYLIELQKLVDKIYTFPFFLDIIRLNIDDTEEDKKLMSLAKRCNGEIHEINSLNSLSDIIEILALKREIFSESLPKKGFIQIPDANVSFYENLGEPLIDHTEVGQCSICFQKGEKEMVQCPNCLSIAHKACYANWAKRTNIGIPHVFRCHHCYYLLKLDKKYVQDVHSGKISITQEVKVKKVGIQAFLEKFGLQLKPEVKHVQDPLGVVVLKKETMLLNQELKQDPSLKEASQILQSRSRPTVKAKENDVKVMSCINCGKIITSAYAECPNCSFPLF